jgi:hypothetical protein
MLKAWVAAGIPFSVIENPFIIDLFMRLNPGYIPSSRATLSGRILQEEALKVKTKINKTFEHSENLTLCKQLFINIIYLLLLLKNIIVFIVMKFFIIYA